MSSHSPLNILISSMIRTSTSFVQSSLRKPWCMRRKSSWHLGTPMPVALWIVVPFTCVAAMPVGAQTATFCEYLCGHKSVS